jgi:hypothetical protein
VLDLDWVVAPGDGCPAALRVARRGSTELLPTRAEARRAEAEARRAEAEARAAAERCVAELETELERRGAR